MITIKKVLGLVGIKYIKPRDLLWEELNTIRHVDTPYEKILKTIKRNTKCRFQRQKAYINLVHSTAYTMTMKYPELKGMIAAWKDSKLATKQYNAEQTTINKNVLTKRKHWGFIAKLKFFIRTVKRDIELFKVLKQVKQKRSSQ